MVWPWMFSEFCILFTDRAKLAVGCCNLSSVIIAVPFSAWPGWSMSSNAPSNCKNLLLSMLFGFSLGFKLVMLNEDAIFCVFTSVFGLISFSMLFPSSAGLLSMFKRKIVLFSENESIFLRLSSLQMNVMFDLSAGLLISLGIFINDMASLFGWLIMV